MHMWKRFGDMGFLGPTVPEEYGGLGLGYLEPVSYTHLTLRTSDLV